MGEIRGKSNILGWFEKAGVGGNTQVKVIEVFYVPETKTWEVNMRPVSDDGEPGAWASHDAPGDGLAELLGIARDTVTGG